MLKRNERGKLSLNSLDLQIFFDDLFENCKTEDEVEWLTDQLSSILEITSEEVLEHLNDW